MQYPKNSSYLSSTHNPHKEFQRDFRIRGDVFAWLSFLKANHPDYEQIAIRFTNGPTNYMHTANLSGLNEIRKPQLVHLRAYGCRAYARSEDV
jgi:hypothetical protein